MHCTIPPNANEAARFLVFGRGQAQACHFNGLTFLSSISASLVGYFMVRMGLLHGTHGAELRVLWARGSMSRLTSHILNICEGTVQRRLQDDFQLTNF